MRSTLFLQVLLPPQWEATVFAKSCLLATPSCLDADFCPSICPQLEVLGRAILTPPSHDPSKGLTQLSRGLFNVRGFLLGLIQALNTHCSFWDVRLDLQADISVTFVLLPWEVPNFAHLRLTKETFLKSYQW